MFVSSSGEHGSIKCLCTCGLLSKYYGIIKILLIIFMISSLKFSIFSRHNIAKYVTTTITYSSSFFALQFLKRFYIIFCLFQIVNKSISLTFLFLLYVTDTLIKIYNQIIKTRILLKTVCAI